MAEMKTADIRAMSPDQMDDAVLNLKKERFNLRFQRATGQLENTSRLREARRDIARVKPGRILFEVDGVPIAVAKEALALAAAKLPVKTRFIERIAE